MNFLDKKKTVFPIFKKFKTRAFPHSVNIPGERKYHFIVSEEIRDHFSRFLTYAIFKNSKTRSSFYQFLPLKKIPF